ncbi:helix-turn-helix transcriptional regulator [Elioraea sp. Yellowstone]|jgi:ubiquinone biosynthesis protein COQ9|uniref:TetR family transcriptional regulator n=1 Tax=Elioraea sp. Yellowstone TaxID=2592070 RepID=UPI00114F5431|nr:TetR family transcriptional regulator [Elioraea sp. Yellowstone]TQF78119.1 helix-turn-helix transcriptional regulator [Elioraea sp. Yellowstone]
MDGIDAFDRDVTAALMRVAAREGWSGATLPRIAAEAGTTLAALRARFADRAAILDRFVAVVDAAVLAGTMPPNESDTPKDRLFDVLMRRFDALAPHRAGVLACWRGVRRDPVALACRVPAALTAMRWMLEAAGIPATGPAGMLRAKGLLAVWAAAFRAWETDETPDLAPTMAALDTALTRAESLAETLEPLLGRPSRPQPDAAPGAGSEPDPAA